MTTRPTDGAASAAPVFSAHDRRITCVHEAAHAVVASLGGLFVYSVEAAPVGATDWTTTGRKGGVVSDVWGLCSTSDLAAPYSLALRWNADESTLEVNRAIVHQYLAILARPYRAECYRAARAYVCMALAGPIAESILAGEDPPYWPESEAYWIGSPDDVHVAESVARLLPFRNELDHAIEVTTAELVEHWDRVIRVADALEQAGKLEDELEHLLTYPAKRPPTWPPSPRSVRRGKEVQQ